MSPRRPADPVSRGTLHRLAAFTTTPDGGNPAGVSVGEQLPPSDAMQRIAPEVGYSETAFVAPARGPRRSARYFSPEAEVFFCGHATIALGESEGDGVYRMDTRVGEVPVPVRTRDALRELMLRDGLTTVQLVWRESDDVFHSRNPFPVGGVVEDPATGAAAAALGGYLRDAGLVRAPASLLIRQGERKGRPSRLHVEIPAAGGITVAGTAVVLALPE